MPRLYPSLIINLIGSNKNVSIAKNEIRNYSFEHYFSFKEVENKYLKQELERDYLTKDLYINPCYWITCDEIKNIHELTKNQKYLNSYAFLVNSIDDTCQTQNIDNNSASLFNCKYIHDIYNIKKPLKEKESLLFSLLFSDHSRFKFHD
jgi:hypothetical protein